MVSPCEQVTLTSGKKKRKRSLNAAAKHAQTLAKLMKEEIPVLASVMLGDEAGLDNFEMRHYIKEVLGEPSVYGEEPANLGGFMVYGTDVLPAPQAF